MAAVHGSVPLPEKIWPVRSASRWKKYSTAGQKCKDGGNKAEVERETGKSFLYVRGQGDGARIATTSLRTGLAMTPFTRSVVQVRAGGQGRPPLRRGHGVRGRRDDVGSESSAAGGGGSEMSEWPRSKFPASAVRQRRNFGHRNRVIRNTPVQIQRRTDCHNQ